MVKRHKFAFLLVSLVAVLLAHPLTHGVAGAALYDALVAIVFLSAIVVLFESRRSHWIALLLGLPSILGIFTNYALPNASAMFAAVYYHAIPVAFLLYAVGAILKELFTSRGVTRDSILGAFCGYLLLALAFSHMYGFMELLRPGSFWLQEHMGPLPPEGGDRRSLLTYFSLSTITTAAFGDIVPSSRACRMLATLEAVVGQFYLAAIVAQLIGLKVSSAIPEYSPDQSNQLDIPTIDSSCDN